MPSRNSVKQFAPQQMWHVYNRGVDGRDIFGSEKDYVVFLSYLKICLSAESPERQDMANALDDIIRLRRLNLHNDVELISYCLMPNHFHLQLYQHTEDGVSRLMRSLSTGYVMYFNKMNERSGRLFQGTYKASLIDSESYWHHVSRYIHLNPLDIGQDYRTYSYSSYRYFVNPPAPEWLQPGHVLHEGSAQRYREFVADYVSYKRELKDLKSFLANS